MKKFMSILLVVLTLLSLAACQDSPDPSATTTAPQGPKELVLSNTYVAITKDVQMPEMLRIDQDLMLDLYGIQAADCKQAEIYLCSNALQADEIWLIEAVDEEALQNIKSLAQARLQQKDDESLTYSPAQNAIVKKAHLETYDNYLVMIVSPEVEAITAAFKTEAGV